MKEKGQNYWAGSTGTPQGQGREGVLCYPFSIQISVTPFSSSFLQSTCRCYSGEAAQESEFVPSWEKQMWMWEVKALCRTLVGLEKGRHQIAPNTGLEAEQAKKGSFSFFHPFPPPKGHQLEPDPAGSPSHDFMLFFLSALAAPFFSYILISYPVPCMNKRCHILP